MVFRKVILTFFFTSLAVAAFSQPTQIVYLSGIDAANTVDWDFYCTDGRNSGEWATIPVPSNWELEGFGIYNYGHDWANDSIILGKERGLYKHEFQVPEEWKGKTVNVVFDGVMTDCKVKINGRSAGELHQGAFYRFKYDISNLLKYGEPNLLEVDVAKHSANKSVNRAERQADFWIFGGIFRPVFLEVLPKLHIERAAIDPKADGSFSSLIVLNQSANNNKLEVELLDMDGNRIGNSIRADMKKGQKQVSVSGKFENIMSWNPEHPHLYDMKITLRQDSKVLHEVTQRIGFRTVELRRHDGFYINGKKVVFKGVNRHSFWPETGRCLSEEHHVTDIRLMKEMNMNAVRMSHYVPDKRFLELCDSLGLFVMNEIAGWQQGYDTIVGQKIVKETVLKDENHPSVVIWNNGNEGGWDFENEKAFRQYDIQNRPVLYPWLKRNGVDTNHYINYQYATRRYVNGIAPFLPTEFLHGLYDGGHGAGLEDYWSRFQSSPLHAGGFLWVLADEAVLRTDKEGTVYDGDGNHAPDGILGPHREKEGSFYTIKEIWSPVQIKPLIINKHWDGNLLVENKFIYTNLQDCNFSWKVIKTGFDGTTDQVEAKGSFAGPDALPGEVKSIHVDCRDALQNGDLFTFTANDHHGKELYTWSWPLIEPEEKMNNLISQIRGDESDIVLNETSELLHASVGELEMSFSKTTGDLVSVKNRNGVLSFSGGTRVVGVESEVTDVVWSKDKQDQLVIDIHTSHYPEKISWTLTKNGLLLFEANGLRKSINDIDFVGISFNYPEEKCKKVQWMGDGPYRVWKNRMKGVNAGVWEKEYNNTITGESFNDLIYPEFKGYHSNLFWVRFETNESPFTVISGTSNLFLHLFTPDAPKHVAGGVHPPFPDGDVSFLYEIPAIGTKFKQPDELGPQSQKGKYWGHPGDEMQPIVLGFDFRGLE